MTRVEYFETGGKRFPLVFSLFALKAMTEKYGGVSEYLTAIKEEGMGFHVLLWGFQLVNRCGCEYINKFVYLLPDEGIEREPAELAFLKGLKVTDVPRMIDAMMNAYTTGIKQEITAELTKEARKNEENVVSDSLVWFDYHCRRMRIPYEEYSLMTVGEINDLITCAGIQNGALKETIDTPYIPDLR